MTLTNSTSSKPKRRYTYWSLPISSPLENARLYLAWSLHFYRGCTGTLLLVHGRRRQRSLHQGG